MESHIRKHFFVSFKPYIFYPNLGAIEGASMSVVRSTADMLDLVQAPFVVLFGAAIWVPLSQVNPEGAVCV